MLLLQMVNRQPATTIDRPVPTRGEAAPQPI
jgi:hypothetical protein